MWKCIYSMGEGPPDEAFASALGALWRLLSHCGGALCILWRILPLVVFSWRILPLFLWRILPLCDVHKYDSVRFPPPGFIRSAWGLLPSKTHT